MEESFNGSRVFIPRDNIRSIQSDLKDQLNKYEISVSDTNFLESSSLCECVRDQILNYEDESHLTKCQNNCRRIFIASDLLLSICSVYWDVVDYEVSKMICDLLQWEKYKKVCREITKKIHLESKAEKSFAKEALNKLKEAEIRDSEAVARQGSLQIENAGDSEAEFVVRLEAETPPGGQKTVEAVENGAPQSETNGNLNEMISAFLESVTTIRDEPVADTSGQQFPISNISREVFPVPDPVVESSVQEPEARETPEESLREILEILEDPQTHAIEQPETFLGSPEKLPVATAVEQRSPDEGERAVSSEDSDKWSLPALESDETTRRKHRRLIIDEETVIHQYAERAMRLNRAINPQRVEVFEGPPDILQAFSANHLMKTPSFKCSSRFRDVRSSKLSTLYNRHLKTGTKPVEPILFERRAIDEHRSEISKLRAHHETVEDVGTRAGMHSAVERSDILAEVAPKKSRLEDLEIAPPAVLPRESLVGMPLARIVNSTIPPLEETELERINIAAISPRRQRLQGQSIDPKTTAPWFLCIKQNPPSAKYREFNYVYQNIQRYWLLYEEERMEKCVTLREFLSLESAESAANFFTVLRIVDKMSIQRKLKLEYKDGDVLIRPFESPHFSNGQLILQREEESVIPVYVHGSKSPAATSHLSKIHTRSIGQKQGIQVRTSKRNKFLKSY